MIVMDTITLKLRTQFVYLKMGLLDNIANSNQFKFSAMFLLPFNWILMNGNIFNFNLLLAILVYFRKMKKKNYVYNFLH